MQRILQSQGSCWNFKEVEFYFKAVTFQKSMSKTQWVQLSEELLASELLLCSCTRESADCVEGNNRMERQLNVKTCQCNQCTKQTERIIHLMSNHSIACQFLKSEFKLTLQQSNVPFFTWLSARCCIHSLLLSLSVSSAEYSSSTNHLFYACQYAILSIDRAYRLSETICMQILH